MPGGSRLTAANSRPGKRDPNRARPSGAPNRAGGWLPRDDVVSARQLFPRRLTQLAPDVARHERDRIAHEVSHSQPPELVGDLRRQPSGVRIEEPAERIDGVTDLG